MGVRGSLSDTETVRAERHSTRHPQPTNDETRVIFKYLLSSVVHLLQIIEQSGTCFSRSTTYAHVGCRFSFLLFIF